MSDMNSRYARRLQKELMDIQKNPPPGIAVQEVTNLHKWRIHADGAQGSVYAGERFELQFVFPQNYPLEAPEVIFVGNHVPIHPRILKKHVYDGWSPALSVTSVVLSVLSMLSSCTDKQRPPDNDTYIRNAIGRSPKDTRWWFHDDSV